MRGGNGGSCLASRVARCGGRRIMSDGSAREFKGHRWFAAIYDAMMRGSERKFLAKHRSYIVGEAEGRVLEVGAGTGASLSYYGRAEKVIATEPDPYMLERAHKRL